MVSPLPAPFSDDLKVLVLAGSNPVSARRRRRLQERVRRGEPEVPLTDKAFMPLRGRLVIEYVLDWLQASGLQRVWVLADSRGLARVPDRYRFQPIPQRPGASLFANLSLAHAALAPAPDEPVLIVFGDHPLNSQAALHAFLHGCASRLHEADFFHGLALSDAYSHFAPWFRRTCANMRELSGRASGLNLAVPSRLHRLKVLDEMYAVRKQERVGAFLQLLGLLTRWLGWRSLQALVDCTGLWVAKEIEKRSCVGGRRRWLAMVLLRWIRARLPARRMEGYVARILGAERGVRLVPLHHGGIAIDVDFAEELQHLEHHWEAIRSVAAGQDAALLGTSTAT